MEFKKCPIKPPTEKLVRGVIYDDVCKKEMAENMLDLLDERNQYSEEINTAIQQIAKETGSSFDDYKNYCQDMDAIAAMTRYDSDTGVMHNMIIPKECLSISLVKELEKVDLGKELMETRVERMATSHMKPEDFCDEEEEFLEKNVDKYTKESVQKPKEGKYFIDGKRVSAEEMAEFLENNPAFSYFLSNPFFYI